MGIPLLRFVSVMLRSLRQQQNKHFIPVILHDEAKLVLGKSATLVLQVWLASAPVPKAKTLPPFSNPALGDVCMCWLVWEGAALYSWHGEWFGRNSSPVRVNTCKSVKRDSPQSLIMPLWPVLR